MKGCLRPGRNAFRWRAWLEDRLRKFWMRTTPDKIRSAGDLWGYGQIQIFLDGEEWRGRIKECKFLKSPSDSANQTTTVRLTLYWFVRKKVRRWKDSHLIDRTSVEWDRILHPYVLVLALKNVQQTKIKPRRMYFEASASGETGYFSVRHDLENISWRQGRIFDPSLQQSRP